MGSLGVEDRMDMYGSTDMHSPAPSGAIVREQGREKHFLLADSGITLSSCKTSRTDITELSIPWRDVIGGELEQTKSNKAKSGNSQTSTMVIHYMQHKVKDKTIRPTKVKVSASRDHVVDWIRRIREHCGKVPGRPRKVLVIINPISGNRQGPQIVSKTIQPLFQQASIHTTVISTERRREAVDVAENLDLAEYDGLVCVGGDGHYNEVLEGLAKQMQRRAGIDINNPDVRLSPINIPVGLIPTGTGNAVSRWANGVTDVYTAVLNVIRGQQQRAQISRVYSNGAFLCMSGVNVVYGMMSDMMKRSDELRWMKTKRYPYAMLRMVLGRKRMFHCRVQYKTSSDHLSGGSNGSSKTGDTAPSSSLSEVDGPWQEYDPQGQRFRCLMSLSCDQVDSEESHAIQTITGSDCPLVIDHGCFSPKLLKYLLNYISPVKSVNTSNKIHVLKGLTAYRMMLTENDEVRPGGWCSSQSKDRELERLAAVDGEVIPLVKPMLDVRIVGGFIPLYGCLDQVQNDAHTQLGDGVSNRAFDPANED
ncbi:ceramide kinase [Elysia marginata]|uniref:Ceramide kinase n=1 Tax=Elysia marginata TaxID=1093978 RepID=A0AAV4JBU6_9GAST|nr:ceramide kinase [Elysia marginata]